MTPLAQGKETTRREIKSPARVQERDVDKYFVARGPTRATCKNSAIATQPCPGQVNTFENDELRLGVGCQGFDRDAEADKRIYYHIKWYHPLCFFWKVSRARKKIFVNPATSFVQWNTLDHDTKQEILDAEETVREETVRKGKGKRR